MGDFIIETSQLTKSFRGHPALRGVDLQVPVGSIFGFLGRNGARKTTTIKTLIVLLRSDSGSGIERFRNRGMTKYGRQNGREDSPNGSM